MDGELRRNEITQNLLTSDKAISASSLAKKYGVSRQVIVGDVALLRASGMDILATNKGYILPQHNNGIIRIIPSFHKPQDIEQELTIIVQHGAKLLDVTVEHQIYGSITANLHIENMEDIKHFLQKRKELGAKALSELTEGVHSHKIWVENLDQFEKLVQALDEAGLLFK